jgi:hypothetical protein
MNINMTSQSANSTARALSIENFLSPISVLVLVMSIYTMPIASVIGYLLNIPCLIVLCHRKLKGDTYKYLIFKTLAHLIFLFSLTIIPLFSCSSCPASLTYIANLIRWLLSFYGGNVLTTSATLVEIALSYERLLLLKQQKSKYLIKLHFWPTTIGMLIISIVFNLPLMFAFQIELIPGSTDFWRLSRTAFGDSAFYRSYITVFNLIQAFLALLLLVALNILNKIEFSNYMKRKKNLINSTNRAAAPAPKNQQ